MKEPVNDMNDGLLVKYLTGEASPVECTQVQQWLEKSDDNRRYYEDFEQVWEQSLRLAVNTKKDEEASWKQLQQRIVNTHEKIKTARQNNTQWLRVAAIFIAMVAIGYITYNVSNLYMSSPTAMVNSGAKDKVVVDTLADGSVVTINKNSVLSHPSAFKGDTRTVNLQGEAFFNIAPNKQKPFIITVNDVTVKVLGTSFNIRSVNGNTEVIVETGIVEVKRKDQSIQLLPKEKILVAQNDAPLVKDSANDQLYKYYRNKEFICDGTSLQKLVTILNEAYSVNITIENKALENIPINTVFKNEPLENILNILSKTLDIKVAKQQGQIILR